MMDVTSKLLIFDGDNGGELEHLPFLVRSLERANVSALIIEDKIGTKEFTLLKISLERGRINQIVLQKK